MARRDIYSVDGEDAAMEAASQASRKTFKFLWRELSWEQRRIIPGVDLAAIKVPFPVDEPRRGQPTVEHMWVSDLDFDGGTIRGSLLNDPQWVTTVAAGDPVSCSLDDIADWMYAVTGAVCGAYTVNLMRSRMSAPERRQHDNAWGLKFGDPDSIRLVPAAHTPKPKSRLARLTRRKPAPQDAAQLSRTEHPMCLNMADALRDAIQEHPGMATDADDDGWLMLHREALAGNGPVVRILIDHGADVDGRTPDGRTALDLAGAAGWPSVIDALRD